MSSQEFTDIDIGAFLSGIAGSLLKVLIFLLQVAVVIYVISLVRGKSKSLPDLPWVAENDKAWILRDFRTRWWCTMNYEDALRKAYDEVCSLSLFINRVFYGTGLESGPRRLVSKDHFETT